MIGSSSGNGKNEGVGWSRAMTSAMSVLLPLESDFSHLSSYEEP